MKTSFAFVIALAFAGTLSHADDKTPEKEVAKESVKVEKTVTKSEQKKEAEKKEEEKNKKDKKETTAVTKKSAVSAKDLKGKTVIAAFETNKGTFKVKLWPDKAPETVQNFVGLATGEKEWTHPGTGKKMTGTPLYDGTVFHRLIPNFMIQGGDPLGKGIGGPGYQFKDEIHDKNVFDKVGLLAMANAGPGTNGSQFFVTVEKTTWLNKNHTIFGETIEGYPVVEAISKLGNGSGTPSETVTLKHVKIEIK